MSNNGVVPVIRVAPRREVSTCGESDAREAGRALIQSVLSLMIDRPEHTQVTYSTGDRTTIFKVGCHPQSLGQLIGGKGKNISGLRAVISAIMARQGIRAIIEIPYLDPQGNSACD